MHPARCARDAGGHFFGSQDYSKEELIAEIGACYLCHFAGIEGTFDNSAAYIKNWLSALRNDPKFIIMASSGAQKAVDYIKNVKWENKNV
jgi:antirestriction protein ArdC